LNRKLPAYLMILIGWIFILPVQALEKPISLWLLETEHSKVYLLGSVHAMKAEMYPLAAPIEKAFKEARKIAFEVDLTRLNQTEMNQIMQQHGFYTPPASIESDLPKETLGLLKDYLKENNLSFSNIRRMKPWFLMLTIGQTELAKHGFDSQYGIDQQLQQRALSIGKEILQLESFREQIELLSSDSMEVQELSLRATLEERVSLEEDLNVLITAWQNGNADRMLELAVEATAHYPELNQQTHNLIDNRNLKMANKIREYVAASGTYLVVVGALHMGGERGLVKLLSKDYSVKQLRH
jgi:uncharacterized protein